MILSDDFVFVHYPKTGGTFVSRMLQQILDRTGRSFELGKRRHAICDEIPAQYHGRTIVSCVRNPYDIKVSQYRYEHWARHPKPDVEERIRSKYPHFPKLSFEEFVDTRDTMGAGSVRNAESNPFILTTGHYTQKFIRFFARDHERVVRELDEELITAGPIDEHMHDVVFLRTHRLNEDLHLFLRNLGLPKADIEFVLREKRILPRGGRRKKRDRWQKFYTPELKAQVRHRERMIFRMFPEFDSPSDRGTTSA